jgi:hypothetical protein
MTAAVCAWCSAPITDDDSFVRLLDDSSGKRPPLRAMYLHTNNALPDCFGARRAWFGLASASVVA